jgi:predicted porin
MDNIIKRIFPVTLFFILFSVGKIVAQDNGMAYNPKSSDISGGYGFINVWKTLFAFDNIQLPTSSEGPFVVKYEYGITKKMSAAVTVGYAELNSNYENITQKLSDYLVAGTASYHFATSRKLDPYVSAGFGYYAFTYADNVGDDIHFILPGPFAVSLAAGTRYYFNPHFGAYAEAGYDDGGIIQIGLVYKTR